MADELHPGSGTYTHDTRDIKGVVIEVDGASAVRDIYTERERKNDLLIYLLGIICTYSCCQR
jgi:hypothetical protein